MGSHTPAPSHVSWSEHAVAASPHSSVSGLKQFSAVSLQWLLHSVPGLQGLPSCWQAPEPLQLSTPSQKVLLSQFQLLGKRIR